MSEIPPLWLIIGGGLLLVAAVLVSFFMVTRIMEPSYLLVFVTYGASFVGLIIGVIGVAMFSTRGRDR
ncbi:MAG: hypothetical protein R2873_28230 [Caldilineaceae bacterium]